MRSSSTSILSTQVFSSSRYPFHLTRYSAVLRLLTRSTRYSSSLSTTNWPSSNSAYLVHGEWLVSRFIGRFSRCCSILDFLMPPSLHLLVETMLSIGWVVAESKLVRSITSALLLLVLIDRSVDLARSIGSILSSSLVQVDEGGVWIRLGPDQRSSLALWLKLSRWSKKQSVS